MRAPCRCTGHCWFNGSCVCKKCWPPEAGISRTSFNAGAGTETTNSNTSALAGGGGEIELSVSYGCVVDTLTIFLRCILRQAKIFHSGILTCLASWARSVLSVDFACPRNGAGVSNTHANSKSTAARIRAFLDDDGTLHRPKAASCEMEDPRGC